MKLSEAHVRHYNLIKPITFYEIKTVEKFTDDNADSRLSSLLGAVNDLDKFRFQGRATNKEAVDVRLGIQLVAVGSGGRASVQNAGLVSNGGGDVLG